MVVSALVHGVCLFAGTSVFFGLTFWLATCSPTTGGPALIACAMAIGLALCEVVLSRA